MQSLDSARNELNRLLTSADDAIDDVEAELDRILADFGDVLDDVKDYALPDAVAARDDIVSMGKTYWQAAYQVTPVCLPHLKALIYAKTRNR